jgi:hypothetical protein
MVYSDKIHYRTKMLWTSITLMLSLASEIEIHFDFGRADVIKHLWRLFEGVSDISKEFYTRRYSNLLM